MFKRLLFVVCGLSRRSAANKVAISACQADREVDEVCRLLNLHRHKKSRHVPGRDGLILSDHTRGGKGVAEM